MEKYRVLVHNDITIIEHTQQEFKMSVYKEKKFAINKNTAHLEATLYMEDGVFIKNCNYTFEALDKDNMPICEVDITSFKSAIEFFFISIISTDLFVISTPKSSALCGVEMKKFLFE